MGSDEVYTIKELAELIRNTLAPQKEIIILGDLHDESRANYIPSIEKSSLLGLRVWTSLQESINEMKNHFN